MTIFMGKNPKAYNRTLVYSRYILLILDYRRPLKDRITGHYPRFQNKFRLTGSATSSYNKKKPLYTKGFPTLRVMYAVERTRTSTGVRPLPPQDSVSAIPPLPLRATRLFIRLNTFYSLHLGILYSVQVMK